MKTLVLLGHGNFASGLKSALVMISGLKENIIDLDFYEHDNLANYQKSVFQILSALKKRHIPYLIGVDLIGGTPFLSAAAFLKEDPLMEIIVGINLPTALDYLINEKPEIYEPKYFETLINKSEINMEGI